MRERERQSKTYRIRYLERYIEKQILKVGDIYIYRWIDR